MSQTPPTTDNAGRLDSGISARYFIGMEATRLERLRKEQGLSRPKLARMAEVSESTIIRIERNHGYDPGVFLMRRIAASLDVAVDDLLEPAPTTGGGE